MSETLYDVQLESSNVKKTRSNLNVQCFLSFIFCGNVESRLFPSDGWVFRIFSWLLLFLIDFGWFQSSSSPSYTFQLFCVVCLRWNWTHIPTLACTRRAQTFSCAAHRFLLVSCAYRSRPLVCKSRNTKKQNSRATKKPRNSVFLNVKTKEKERWELIGGGLLKMKPCDNKTLKSGGKKVVFDESCSDEYLFLEYSTSSFWPPLS